MTEIAAAAVLRPGAYRLVPRRSDYRRGLMSEGGISLLLHLLVLAALIVVLPRQHMSQPSESSEVAVVFDGGQPARTPQTEESQHSPAPTTMPQENARDSRSQPASPRPSGAPMPVSPAPQAPPVSQAVPQPTGAPLPAIALPPAPSDLTMAPPQKPATLGTQAPAHPLARPRPPARQMQRAGPGRVPANSEFAPMNLSLGGAPPRASEGHLEHGILLTMAPTAQNRNIMTRYAEARRKLGEDWWAAFSRFVEDHKYYPLAAAEKGEDGQVVLRMTVQRDGTVQSVQIELSSGSPRLDMAWLSEFRGVKVPAFPPGTVDNQITFSASMTYILEHM